MIVTLADSRALHYCNAGVRDFFARHSLSWPDFVRAGLPSTAFEPMKDDPMVRALLWQATKRSYL